MNEPGLIQSTPSNLGGLSSSQSANLGTSNVGSGKVLKLSHHDAHNQWMQWNETIDVQIENYKEAMLSRGVEEGPELDAFLAEHKRSLLDEARNLVEQASGHLDAVNPNFVPLDNETTNPNFYDEAAERLKRK